MRRMRLILGPRRINSILGRAGKKGRLFVAKSVRAPYARWLCTATGVKGRVPESKTSSISIPTSQRPRNLDPKHENQTMPRIHKQDRLIP